MRSYAHANRGLLAVKLERSVIEDLNEFLKKVREFPAPLPKDDIVSSIGTYISGVQHTFNSDEEEYTKEIRNILLNTSQNNKNNQFSKKMQAVYEACQNDSGQGVTKRSLARIEAFLSERGKDSAFVAVARCVTNKFLETDKRRVTNHVQSKIERLLDQMYASVDGMLDHKIVDEEEATARQDLQELLPVPPPYDWDQANQSLEALKAK